MFPGLAGGTNWYSPAYNPATRLFYVQAHEDYAQIFYKHEVRLQTGRPLRGRRRPRRRGLRALRGDQGHRAAHAARSRWQFPLHSAPSGGVLSTAGGLVCSGNREGFFFALDARTGKPLWRFQTGGLIWSNPITFEVDGRQHVAIPAGQAIFVFALP